MRRRRGFTLVELLVALAVLATLALLGWRGLDAVLGNEARARAALERWDGLDRAMRRIAREPSPQAYRLRDGKLEYGGVVLAEGIRAVRFHEDGPILRVELTLTGGEQAWRLLPRP